MGRTGKKHLWIFILAHPDGASAGQTEQSSPDVRIQRDIGNSSLQAVEVQGGGVWGERGFGPGIGLSEEDSGAQGSP